MNRITPTRAVGIDDKYEIGVSRVYISALQALVRVLLEQRALDAAAGLATAGFVSGYRGSPVAGLDAALWKAASHLQASDIVFQPGLNEELAATAVAGTQQIAERVPSDKAGVFAMWYGKNPGLDRCGDVLKHANQAGTARHGGVLVVTGDDPGAKSSSVANQGEQAFMSARMPILFPATLQDFVDFGLSGLALSRYSGCWIGFKTVSQTVEVSGTVSLDPARWRFRRPPDHDMPADAPRPLKGYGPLRDEARLVEYRLPGAQAFVRANGIDRVALDSPRRRLGIICAGKSYLDVRQALSELDLGMDEAAEIGLRVYKPGMIWPIEPEGLRRFAAGHEELLVVEEKQPVVEEQVARLLYNASERPGRIVGKRDESGAPLLPETGELSPMLLAEVIDARLRRMGVDRRRSQRLTAAREAAGRAAAAGAAPLQRRMFFCSGCPHNTSTRVPDGSRAMGGIGCSSMAMLMPDRETELHVQMGGEGVNWIGQAPFARERHVFQNLGDGTYVHSGLLAIRAAVAARVNITYKLLYNDAVAMTGGQPVEGAPSAADIVRQLHAERVSAIAVVTDQPDRYRTVPLPDGVAVHHRRELDHVQRELGEIEGVTVLLYDQTCAAEKRRRRKRGRMEEPDMRLFIHPEICEGCGDCSRASNCISVQPLETPLGRKRKIDQSNCNMDYSCLDGFCPSFVSLRGARQRKKRSIPAIDPIERAAALPPCPVAAVGAEPYNVLVTGIGGTGILTLSALVGMAAHVAGLDATVLDETGIAQKNGAVSSHLRIAAADLSASDSRIVDGAADVLLACDSVVGASPDALRLLSPARSSAVVNLHVAPPAAFVADNAIDLEPRRLLRRIESVVGAGRLATLDSSGAAVKLIGSSIAGNILLLGFAAQRGLLPVPADAIAQAIEMNGTEVDQNLRAFAWGRIAAADPDGFARIVAGDRTDPAPTETLETLVADRVARLSAYQDAAYGRRYRRLVERAASAERDAGIGSTAFSEAVARNLFKLMAYKDEYEVARLLDRRALKARLADEFEGDFRLSVNLAPPLLASRDGRGGQPHKREYGPWIFPLLRLLASARRVRGTFIDPFGYTSERRLERQLIRDYEATIEELGAGLAPGCHRLATRIASIPDGIRGFGHVKRRSIETASQEWQRLMQSYRLQARSGHRLREAAAG